MFKIYVRYIIFKCAVYGMDAEPFIMVKGQVFEIRGT